MESTETVGQRPYAVNAHLWGMVTVSHHINETASLPAIVPDWFVPLHGHYRQFFMERLSAMQGAVAQLHADGLAQITPVLLVTGKTVAQLRAELGRAAWRRIHHDTEATNFLKCLIWLKYQGDASWADICALPRVHLRSCRNAIDWPTAKFAAHLATPGQFAQVAMLYRDTLKIGGDPKSSWNLPRLRREHDSLAAELSIKRASPAIWAEPFEYQTAGFLFRRLISDRDLVQEGKRQRHCLAAYIQDARAGQCVSMACTGRERATLRFGQKGDWELSSFANGPVSEDCAHAARSAQRAYLRNLKSSASEFI